MFLHVANLFCNVIFLVLYMLLEVFDVIFVLFDILLLEKKVLGMKNHLFQRKTDVD